MKLPLGNSGATYLRNVTDTVLYRLYNTVTVSVHSNNIGTSVDVAVGCMQGSIVKHHDLLHGSFFIFICSQFEFGLYVKNKSFFFHLNLLSFIF